MEYNMEEIHSGPSRHGTGVFASRSFSTGDYVGPVPGEVITDPEYGSEYAIDLGDRSLEPAAPFRFLNHCCQPNCALVISEEPSADGSSLDPVVWLEILCPIEAGEPMTIDYAWHADAAIPCQCGAATCRGWIVDQQALSEIVDAAPQQQASVGDAA